MLSQVSKGEIQVIFTVKTIELYCQIYFHQHFYFEVMIGSQAIVIDTTESSYISITQFPPMLLITQYHNQDINIDTVHQYYSDFFSLMCTCMCMTQFYTILSHTQVCDSTTSQDTDQFYHCKDPSGCPIQPHTLLAPCHLSFLIPDNHKSVLQF